MNSAVPPILNIETRILNAKNIHAVAADVGSKIWVAVAAAVTGKPVAVMAQGIITGQLAEEQMAETEIAVAIAAMAQEIIIETAVVEEQMEGAGSLRRGIERFVIWIYHLLIKNIYKHRDFPVLFCFGYWLYKTHRANY